MLCTGQSFPKQFNPQSTWHFLQSIVKLPLLALIYDAAKMCLQKELKDIERDKESGVRVELIGNSIRHLTGYVQGTKLHATKNKKHAQYFLSTGG